MSTAAATVIEPWIPRPESHHDWAELTARAPQLTATMRRYLVQLTTFLAPRSVDVADSTLRQLARWLTTHTDITVVADIARTHIEDYKVWLAAQPGTKGPTLAKNTQRQRLRMIRIFLERLIEWDWPDAPGRNPILHGDIPPRPEPIPKFLTDRDAARFMAAARTHRLPRYRFVAEMLARTGLRAGELCDLAADAVTEIGDAHWLRVPVGKLRNDRFIPLHPDLVALLAEWTAVNADHIRTQHRLLADHHAPIERRTVHRIVSTIGRHAGIGPAISPSVSDTPPVHVVFASALRVRARRGSPTSLAVDAGLTPIRRSVIPQGCSRRECAFTEAAAALQPAGRGGTVASRGRTRVDAASVHCAGVAGWMFLLFRNTLSGSYLAFTSTSRR